MEDIDKMLEQQQEELERIRRKRGGVTNTESLRKVLNVLFLILALVGVVLYFSMPDRHLVGLCVIALGMVLKIAEFFIRFMF